MIIIIVINAVAFAMNMSSAYMGNSFDPNSFAAGVSLADTGALVIREVARS